jgi:two-component system chemotaxis response regulator CheY
MAKILIIDDSLLSRRMLRKILEEDSHEVVEAKDGYSALEIFSLENPQLVMLDLTMPGMNGFEVLNKLKSINPAIKVIIATADIQNMTRDIALHEGADGFITKPFVSEEITELVHNLLSYVHH